MYRRFSLITGFAMGIGLAGSACAEDIADGVAGIPASVQDVRIGGTWETDDKVGAYRVVITRGGADEVVTRLFIQWIALDDAGEAGVDHSVQIKELADLGLDIVDYQSDSDEDGFSMYIETHNPAEEIDETYELFVFSPTEYIFGPATN